MKRGIVGVTIVALMASPVFGQTFPPGGFDTFPSTGNVRIYADPGCTTPVTGPIIVQGPTKIKRTDPAGLQPNRTIDTEIISMSLTGNPGVLIIEAPGGSDPNNALVPPCAAPGPAAGGGPGCSPGQIQSDPTPGDFPADSFFDVFVEVHMQGFPRMFNQVPIQMQAVINRIPPAGTIYMPPGSPCIPLHDIANPFGPPIVFISHLAHEVGEKNQYKCYKAKDLKNPKFVPVTVSLDDQFGPQPIVTVKQPFLLCNPASKNGEPIEDPDMHLCCYKIKGTKVDEDVEVTDQFGKLRLNPKVPQLLCEPCTKVESSLIP